jgi:hypothetical protein
LDDLKALREECCVAVVEVDIVGGGPACAEADGLADDKGDCFSFGLANGFGCRGASLGFMQEFMRLCSA